MERISKTYYCNDSEINRNTTKLSILILYLVNDSFTVFITYTIHGDRQTGSKQKGQVN